MPFSGTCATSNTSMGRKDEREESKGVGKMGWFCCFKASFNISIEKKSPVEGRMRKMEDESKGRTQTHKRDMTGNKNSGFIPGCLQSTMSMAAWTRQCNLRALPMSYCLRCNPSVLSFHNVLLQACPKIMLKKEKMSIRKDYC